MNKGFTLVELLGVVLVLSLIFLVSFPKFLNINKSTNEDYEEEKIDELCEAGKTYIYDNIDDVVTIASSDSKIINNSYFNPQSIIIIEIENLINNDYIKNVDVSLQNGKLKYTVMSDKSLYCEYEEA